MPSIPPIIGEKIRLIRKQKKMTLIELAGLSKCSASLISAVERGTANPSFITLKAITESLGISPSQVLAEDTVSPLESEEISAVFKRGERKTLTIGDLRFELFSRGGNIPFEFVRSEFKPGSSSKKLLPRHEGAECCLVVEGELQIHFENRIYHLKAGDSISFLSHIPHEISNPFKKKATAYWVNSVPWLFSTK